MQYLFFVLEFIFVVILAFYIPGRVALGKLKLSFLPLVGVSIVTGIVLWAMQGLVFGYLHIRWASYIYLLIFFGVFVWQKHFKDFQKIHVNFDIPSLVLIAVGIIGQIFPFFLMGVKTSNGVIIASSNPDDHVWHAALIKELIKRFPPNEPSMAGIRLTDYHYLYNLVTADLIRVFHLPFFATQFDGMYILAPILLGVLAYAIAQSIWNRKLFIRLFLFLLFFAGNAVGWVLLVYRHIFTWNVGSLIVNAMKFVDSPPYAFAILVGLTGFYLLLQTKGKLSKNLIVILAILFGSLLEFKVHVGIPFLMAFGVYSLWFLLKKNFAPFISMVLAGTLAVTLLKLGSSSSAGIIFLPVDVPRDFINQSIFQLKDWQFRWIIYQDHHNIPRLFEYGFFMAGFYLLVQFGLLLFGILPIPTTIKKLGKENASFLYVIVIASFIFGLFFYQTVGGANIWEFFLASFPILCLLTALSVSLLISSKSLLIKTIIVMVVIIVATPQWLISMSNSYKQLFINRFYGVSNSQLASFDFINTHTPQKSVIFLANQHGYAYASTANLFIDRDLYFSGNGVRQIMTPEIIKRRNQIDIVSKGTSSPAIGNILSQEKIQYVYYYGQPKFPSVLSHANLHVVFANKAATIFKLQ